MGSFSRSWNLMQERGPAEGVDRIEHPDYPPDTINWEQLAKLIDIELGDDGIMGLGGSYDLLYRTESTLDTHAGWATSVRHQRWANSTIVIDESAQLTMPVDNRAALTALYVLHLAAFVHDRFGVGADDLEDISHQLTTIARETWPDRAEWSTSRWPTPPD